MTSKIWSMDHSAFTVMDRMVWVSASSGCFMGVIALRRSLAWVVMSVAREMSPALWPARPIRWVAEATE